MSFPASAEVTAPHLKELLSKLPNTLLFKYFATLLETPRPSHAEPCAMRERLIKIGEELGFEVRTDDARNVVIVRPGTAGFEDATPVAVQAHYDMVTSKNSDVDHDFAKDSISAYVADDGWIRAKGTTLGADDGIGCAAALAILCDPELVSAPVEAVFTADEETTMGGAKGISPTILKSNCMINLDSEEWTEICVGCAGGFNVNFTLPVERAAAAPEGSKAFNVAVKGLCGGHTGVNIVEERPNAIKILHKVLAAHPEVQIVSVNAGTAVNAIPRQADATVVVPAGFDLAAIGVDAVKAAGEHPAQNAAAAEWFVEETTLAEGVVPLTADSTAALNKAIAAIHHGVVRKFTHMDSIDSSMAHSVQSLAADSTEFSARTFPRVTSPEGDAAVLAKIADFCKDTGLVASEPLARFGWWEPAMDAPVLGTMKAAMKEVIGKEPHIYSIHAGLECGVIAATYPDMQFVSVGPTIRNAHSPDEMLEISTVMPFYETVVKALAALAPSQLKK